ncbi:hypothetical protein IEC97_19145 [Neobacillus cucumis]|nr:hypothetical protein [Neobacillus cucumis]MBI0579490.1 hypothetical protein [Neobacillus cucumis]
MDVVRGYVRAEYAKKDYGVVIHPATLEIDHVATKKKENFKVIKSQNLYN